MKKRTQLNTPFSLPLFRKVFQEKFEQIQALLEKRFSGKQNRFLVPALFFLPVMLLLVVGIFSINTYIDKECRTTISTLVEKELNRKITVGESSFGLTNINLKNITIFETINGEKPLVTINNIDIYPNFFECLFTSKASLRKVVVNEPKVSVTLDTNGSFNIPELNGAVLVTVKDVIQFISNSQELSIGEMDVEGGLIAFTNNDPTFSLQNFTVTNIEGGLSDFIGLRKYASQLSFLLNYQGKTTDIAIQGGKKTPVSNTIFSIKLDSFDVELMNDLLQQGFPLKQGILSAGLTLEIEDNSKTVDVNGTIEVKHARLSSEDEKGKSLLPGTFQIDQRLTLNVENYATTINKALVSFPESGDILVKGTILPGKNNKNTFALNFNTKDFNVANYLRDIGYTVPAKSKVLVTSAFTLDGSDGQKSIDSVGTAHLSNNEGYEFSVVTDAKYFKKKQYADITLQDVVGKKNGEKKPFLLVKETTFKKTKISAKKIRIGSVYVTVPEFQLVQNKAKKINLIEAIDSFLLHKGTNAHSKKKSYPFYVNYFKVKGGKASYVDKSSETILSHFKLAHINLTASGFGSQSKAKIKVDAKVINPSREAYLFVDGKVNPFTLESQNLKLRVKRLPLKDYSYIAKNMNNISIQDGDLDVFVKVDVDKKSNYISIIDFELYKLKVKFPPEDEAKSAMFVETLKRDGDVIKLNNIKLTGNIKEKNYDFSAIKTAIVQKSLTSAPVLATIGGTAVFSNVLITILAAASPVVLPVTAAVLGGTAIYNMMNNDEETKLVQKK